jgi:prepilin-type processing-associated H-X9-DG protein
MPSDQQPVSIDSVWRACDQCAEVFAFYYLKVCQVIRKDRSYLMNSSVSAWIPVKKINQIPKPSKVPQIVDGTGTANYSASTAKQVSPSYAIPDRRIDYRHNGRCNILTLGGNVTDSPDIPLSSTVDDKLSVLP